MPGLNLAEGCHIVNLLPPADNSGGVVCSVIDVRRYSHVTLIWTTGVTAANIGDITIEEGYDLAMTASPNMRFRYYVEATAAGDVLDTGPTWAVAATGIDGDVSVGGADNTTVVIEIDTSEMTSGYGFLRVNKAAAGGATLDSIVAILSGARYAGYASPTVLA